MILTNDTLLRSYLSHLRSLATKTSALTFEYTNHDDNPGRKALPHNPEINKMWKQLSTDLEKVIDVVITPWNQLANNSELIKAYIPKLGTSNQGDPLRITLGVLKKLADKARLKDESITLLKSWNK